MKASPSALGLPGVSPPALFFSAVLAMVVIHVLFPGPRLLDLPWTLAGVSLLFLGIRLHGASTRIFREQGATRATLAPPEALVVAGPYRRVRNPMYLAGVVILLGVGLLLGSATPFLAPPLFAWLARRWYIRREERLLASCFGEEYEAYRARVPCLIPRWSDSFSGPDH